MAYGDNLLGAGHRWTFNNELTDSVGSLTLTNTGGNFVTTPITRDATHSYQTNDRDDLAVVAPDATTGTSGHDRYAFQGWFRTNSIQGPPCMIHKQGGNTAGFALFIWAGNNLMLQVKDVNANDNIQIFSDIALTNNRSYHFFVRYSGSGFSNEVELYLDGVKQTANRNGVLPGASSMTAYTGNLNWGENGSSSTDVNIGNETVIIKAPVNGLFKEFWTWNGASAESITQSQISNILFGGGAIPELTIFSDSAANMQASLDAIASTVRGDVPLAILVEDVSEGGDLTLTADNVQFNSRGSIDVQWEGSGILTWINENGSNASKSSVVNGGSVDFVESVPVTITALDIDDNSVIEGARVYITESPSGTVLVNDITNASGQVTFNYQYSSDQAITGRIRRGTTSQFYKTAPISGTITSTGFNSSIFMVKDS